MERIAFQASLYAISISVLSSVPCCIFSLNASLKKQGYLCFYLIWQQLPALLPEGCLLIGGIVMVLCLKPPEYRRNKPENTKRAVV